MTDFLKLYPNDDEISNVSTNFNVDKNPRMLVVSGLSEGDCALVEFYVGDDCSGVWLPLKDCCGQVSITSECSNFTILPLSLKYRVFLSNEDDNHLTDPGWFSDVEIYVKSVGGGADLSSFYHSCCGSDSSIDNVISELNRTSNAIISISNKLE